MVRFVGGNKKRSIAREDNQRGGDRRGRASELSSQ